MTTQTEKNKKWLQSQKDKVKTSKAEKQPKTVKVTTLLGWTGVVLIVVGAYFMGATMADVQHNQYKQDVLTEATQIVETLKSKR